MGLRTIYKRPKDDITPRARPEKEEEDQNENENDDEDVVKEDTVIGENEFICRLSMDIPSKEWMVEPFKLTAKETGDEIVEFRENPGSKENDTQNEEKGDEAPTSTSNDVEVNCNPDDDELWNRVNSVLGEFETMKEDFQTMINDLGVQIQRQHFMGTLEAARAQE